MVMTMVMAMLTKRLLLYQDTHLVALSILQLLRAGVQEESVYAMYSDAIVTLVLVDGGGGIEWYVDFRKTVTTKKRKTFAQTTMNT